MRITRRVREWYDDFCRRCIKCGVLPTDEFGCECPQARMRRLAAKGVFTAAEVQKMERP